ncbi:LPS translocon maturation chaperone LptM [Herminiimonas arsenitoxidans]|uniref:LPS translocon maturation chaperone LptM n=1 Tax=Herminiimonas arsenitoxidans TaxID=1809410 RepID=UPI000970AB0C|nr:lipoprotein [Herminiimonas arsenitoxidans]
MKSHSGLSRFVAFLYTLAGIACISLLAGCGQQGPLYMPGSKPPSGQTRKAAPVMPPATTTPAAADTTSSDTK